MNCPLCGEVCRCHSEPPPAALPRPESTPAPPLPIVAQNTILETPCADPQAAGPPEPQIASLPDHADDSAWRDELSARLNRYRARRKVLPPRYPSLRLPFDAFESPLRRGTPPETPSLPALPGFEPASNHALALDGARKVSADSDLHTAPETIVETAPPEPTEHSGAKIIAGAKIIEFPRFAWGPPAPPPDQLAEPVSDRPRILDVPDFAPPPPALGGIIMEAAQGEENEERPGIDIPLQAGSPARRLVAAGIDGLIIASASALFGVIFWKIAAVHPPRVQLLGLGIGIPCLFWAAYHYLMIVYSGGTPGLRAAGLELDRFDGAPARRSLRRWRVLASYLSAASLGMGYAWLFLDEDALCWHDRITHTYLAPRKTQPKPDGLPT